MVIGQVTKPHGVRGEVRVLALTDLPERFTWLDIVYVGERDPVAVAVEAARLHKGGALLKLAGYDTREEAQALRGQLLQVPEEEAIPLAEGEYFLYQLLGLAVEAMDGSALGTLAEVIETGANNVFVVHGAQGEILIPDTQEVVAEIDFDQRRMKVHLLPGLLNA